MRISLHPATADDAEALAELRTEVAMHLTTAYGRGPWSSAVPSRGVLGRMRTGTVFVARQHGRAVATLCLTPRKPWAIDPSYFTPGAQPLYLVDMAVSPRLHCRGIGRICLAEAERIAHAWPADAIRLDAWDAPASAGGEPSALLADGSRIQRLIGELHGAQRQRLGWSEAQLLHEVELVRDVCLTALDQSLRDDENAREAAVAALKRLLDERTRACLSGFCGAEATS